jgi:ribosomal protein S18 acetylase RimI-like enzyme
MAETEPSPVRFRHARADDAERVAALHAASWRRHYRGAYADSFLDADVLADRRAVWSVRLAGPAGSITVLAEDGGGLAGFVHVMLDDDAEWGSLIDNLHVARGRQRTGIGSALLARVAPNILERATNPGVYLWVLEQNTAAQRFYRARGGAYVERAPVPPPGGVLSRLSGAPFGLRFAWPDASVLAQQR